MGRRDYGMKRNNNNNNNNSNGTERKISHLLYMDDLKLLGEMKMS